MKKDEIKKETMIKLIKEHKTFTKLAQKLKMKKYKITAIIKDDNELYEIYKSVNEKETTKKEINSDDEYLIEYFKNRNTQSFQMVSEDINIFERIYFEKTGLKINKNCKHQLISTYLYLYDYIKNKY